MIPPTRLLLLAAALLAASLLPAQASLPSGWTDTDIGSCSPAGNASYDTPSGTFTVNGAGAGVGGTADAFNFCYQAKSGNFTLIARQTSNNGFGGLMVRESLAANARCHLIFTFPQNPGSVWTKLRNATGGSVATYSGPTLSYPMWLKINRAGDCLYCYCSADAVHWQFLYQDTLTGLATNVYAGLTASYSGNGALKAAVYDNVSFQALTGGTSVPGTVVSSWIGNTYANGYDYQEVQDTLTGLYAASDGTVYANAEGTEIGRQWGVYKNGATVGFISSDGSGGAAITGDSTYVYIAQAISSNGPPSGSSWYTVGRFNKSTLAAAPFTGGCGASGNMLEIGTRPATGAKNAWGLALNPTSGVLYVADTPNGKVDLVTTSTMTISTSWTLPSGYTPYALTWDANNSLLWVVVQNTSTGARQVWAYNTSGGQETALTITGAADPVSLAASSNHLYIADNGPDQDVKVYQSIGTAPTFWIEYGQVGGAFSGSRSTIGTRGNWRLDGLTAISIDGSGNIYVSCNGYGPDLGEDGTFRDKRYGTTLESYDLGSRNLNWRLQGLEFVDCIRIDPTDETSAYGNYTHYKLNLSNTTPGSEWTAVGDTLDFLSYPTDFRLGASNTNAGVYQVVYISGQKFLVLGDNYQTMFYRFSTNTGETAIPCVEFNVSTSDPGHSGLSIWTDANGDGTQQTSEFAYAGTYINPLNAAYIDMNGTLWTTSGTNVLKFPCTLSTGGVPQYSWTTKTQITFPSLGLSGNDHLTAGNRLVYDASTDTMYILGFSTNNPAGSSPAGAGSVVVCYTSWSGTPVLSWESVLPVVTTGNDQTSFVTTAMAGAGKYLFVQFEQNNQTLVLSKATGTQVGSIYPDPSVIGVIGWCDYNHGVSAFERSNGEYIITVEDDLFDKSVMYRWTGAP